MRHLSVPAAPIGHELMMTTLKYTKSPLSISNRRKYFLRDRMQAQHSSSGHVHIDMLVPFSANDEREDDIIVTVHL